MKCPGFRCTGQREVIVTWAYHGVLYYPSVHELCEVCADHLCTHVERGDWSNGTPPAYIHVFAPDEPLTLPCDHNIHVRP